MYRKVQFNGPGVEKTRLLGCDCCTPSNVGLATLSPVMYAHCWGKTLLPATITIGVCRIWAICPTREHCNLLFLRHSHDLCCYPHIITGLFLLELATLQNLLHLINLVSAFPYEKKQGIPELTGSCMRRMMPLAHIPTVCPSIDSAIVLLYQ